jgi:hypothetical protein
MTKNSNAVVARGRKPLDHDKKELVKFLIAVREGKSISYYLRNTLLEKGYIRLEKGVANGRGRPANTIVLTGKATGLISLSKTWKSKTVAAPSEEVAA